MNHAEVKWLLDIIAVVLGKKRFGRFAEFIDGDGNGKFSEFVTQKDSELNPENYTDANQNSSICYEAVGLIAVRSRKE